MKNTFLVLLTLLLVLQTKAQTTLIEKRTDSIAKQLIEAVNTNNTQASYALMGSRFKQQISYEKWIGLNKQIGIYLPLQSASFVVSKNNVNKYKTVGGGTYFQLLVGLDSANMVETFLLQPYVEEKKKEVAAATDNKLENLLDSTIHKLTSVYANTVGNVGVSIAVWYNDKAYYYNYGETAKGNQQLPNNQTIYEIGSITKTFAGILLAKAVIEKKLQLTDAITKYLPDSVATNKNLQGITLQMLSNHTSGLPRLPINLNFVITNDQQPYENYNVQHLMYFLKRVTRDNTPGSTYEYSNLAVGLLGVILEKVYKQPFDVLVKKHISTPLQLTHTSSSVTGISNVAVGYNEDGKETPMWNFDCLLACGGLKSTTADLLVYGKSQLTTATTDVFAKSIQLSHNITFTDSSNTIGLGWHYLRNATNQTIIQHSGGTYGARSFLGINKTKKIVVAVLTNNASTGDVLGNNLITALSK